MFRSTWVLHRSRLRQEILNLFPDRDTGNPQIRARGMVVEIEHPTLGRVQTPGSPIKMSETPPVVARPAPLLGEHTREVLREVGYSDAEISTLRLDGALGGGL